MKEIQGDKKMNPQLRKQVQELRNTMEAEALKQPLNPRFKVVQSTKSPVMLITDTETNRVAEVSLCNYLGARKILDAFFGGNVGDEKNEKKIYKKISVKIPEEEEIEEYTTSDKFLIFAECAVTTNRPLSKEEMVDVLTDMTVSGKGDDGTPIEIEVSSVEESGG